MVAGRGLRHAPATGVMLLSKMTIAGRLLSGFLFLVSTISLADGNRFGDYPEQVRPCLAARDALGDEQSYIELSGVNEKGDTCIIDVMFSNQEMLDAFNSERISRGLDPDSVTFEGTTYDFVKSFGTTVPH